MNTLEGCDVQDSLSLRDAQDRRPQPPRRPRGEHVTFDEFFPHGVPPILTAWPPRPIQVGLGKLLVAMVAVGRRKAFRGRLREWTRLGAYCRQLAKADAMRHGLDARPIEPVSEKHIKMARHRNARARRLRRDAIAAAE